jgi:hypothetical protein
MRPVHDGPTIGATVKMRTSSHTQYRLAAGVLAVVATMALAGVWLGLGVIASGGDPASVARDAPPGGAWDAATSFGPVSVRRVERFVGVPHLGHGASTVRSDRIRVSLTLTNRGQAAVPFSPGQFRLRLDALGTTVPATRPDPPPSAIAGGQTLHQRLSFVVPLPPTSFTLSFDDLGRATPLRIRLGAFPLPRKN